MPSLATMLTQERSSALRSEYQGWRISISATTAVLIRPAWAASLLAMAERVRAAGTNDLPALAGAFTAIEPPGIYLPGTLPRCGDRYAY